MLGTAAVAAEGGRDTRVLGDPMDLIRCQNKLPGKARWHVARSTNKHKLGTVGKRLDKI